MNQGMILIVRCPVIEGLIEWEGSINMEERRLGILYVVNRLLDEIDFESKVINIMGNQTWDGWNYGQMGKVLLLYSYIPESVSFTSYLEEYGVKEMLGKREWDFDVLSVNQLFQPHWGRILKVITTTLQFTGEEGWDRKECLPIRKGCSLLVSSNRGYPVECLTKGNTSDAYKVVRFSKRNKGKGVDHAEPFIGLLTPLAVDWQELSMDQTLHTLSAGGKSFLYFSKEAEGLRWIYRLEKIEKGEISAEIEVQLIQLKKKAWEMGYDEGLLWLNRELKKPHPLFASLTKKLKLWTRKQNNRVLLQWKPKDERLSYKKKIWVLNTNLSFSYTDSWIIKATSLREKWIKNRWLVKIKNRETEVHVIPKMAICWVLEQELFTRLYLSGNKDTILNDDGIIRIKWQGDKVIIPSQASRWITRLFPED